MSQSTVVLIDKRTMRICQRADSLEQILADLAQKINNLRLISAENKNHASPNMLEQKWQFMAAENSKFQTSQSAHLSLSDPSDTICYK